MHRPAPVPRFSDRSARRYRDTGLHAHARIHYIVRVFCLHAFTGRVKCLSFSVLWVKAKGKFVFTEGRKTPFYMLKTFVLLCTDFEAFAQDGEGSEGKMQEYCVVCSAREGRKRGVLLCERGLDLVQR